MDAGFGRKGEPLSCEEAGTWSKAGAVGMGELLRGLTGKKAGAKEVMKVCLFLTSYFWWWWGGQTPVVRPGGKYLAFIVIVLRHGVTMCAAG